MCSHTDSCCSVLQTKRFQNIKSCCRLLSCFGARLNVNFNFTVCATNEAEIVSSRPLVLLLRTAAEEEADYCSVDASHVKKVQLCR